MDIARLFKSKVRRALFQLYFTNTESAYYLRQLERMFDMPVSIIRKELMRLETEGVFLSEKKGNLLYYKLNTGYPLFEELKNIVRKTIGINGVLKDAIVKIKGIEKAFIYGSFAQDSEHATSDIDLFILGSINEDHLIREINKAEELLKREINYTLYTREEFRKKKTKKDSFILSLLENPKIMLIGDKDEL